MADDINIFGKLVFQMLYPPDGNSSILEVSESRQGEFLHVALRKDGELIYDFFGASPFSLTSVHFSEIDKVAKQKLRWTDLSNMSFE